MYIFDREVAKGFGHLSGEVDSAFEGSFFPDVSELVYLLYSNISLLVRGVLDRGADDIDLPSLADLLANKAIEALAVSL